MTKDRNALFAPKKNRLSNFFFQVRSRFYFFLLSGGTGSVELLSPLDFTESAITDIGINESFAPSQEENISLVHIFSENCRKVARKKLVENENKSSEGGNFSHHSTISGWEYMEKTPERETHFERVRSGKNPSSSVNFFYVVGLWVFMAVIRLVDLTYHSLSMCVRGIRSISLFLEPVKLPLFYIFLGIIIMLVLSIHKVGDLRTSFLDDHIRIEPAYVHGAFGSEKRGDPEEDLKRYYSLINGNQFSAAYSLLSSRARTMLAYGDFLQMWQPNMSLLIKDTNVASLKGQKAIVRVRLIAEDPDEDGNISATYWQGMVRMTFEKDHWCYDGGHFEKE